MTLTEARHAAAGRLAAAGIEDAALEAEVLLRHALGLDRAAFFARTTDPLPSDAAMRLETVLRRRLAHEPLPYITGHREFYGLDFHVTPAALIPRPETELLVEAALRRLENLTPTAVTPLRGRRGVEGEVEARVPVVVDIGTGSGAIAVAIAANHPTARVIATDVSAEALAAENAARHGVDDRIEFVRTDLLEGLHGPFDVIVANPPYVRTADWEALPPEIRDHEPRLALAGGVDGLDLVRRLLTQAAPHVAAGAALYVEIGDEQGEAELALARAAMPGRRIAVRKDLAYRDRVLAVEPGR